MSAASESPAPAAPVLDPALQPPPVLSAPCPGYAAAKRKWQGIPGLERAPAGRLWAAWYSGGLGEGPDNYVVLVTSEDDGATWSDPALVVDPPGRVRAFDPCLWHDPLGRLWLFWAQSAEWFDGQAGVWAIRTDDASGPAPRWTAPHRIADGVMMNKPLVLSSGEWLLPVARWNRAAGSTSAASGRPEQPDLRRKSNVHASEDRGETWALRGGADVPDRTFDEHMLVERRDGTLWMLVRTSYGIGESVSADRGRTWSPGRPSILAGPNSRFFVRRLPSGRLLQVNHCHFTGRSRLTALLSEDDGLRWKGGLLLDERSNVSYPDGVAAEDGRIYVIYDRERRREGEILLAVFREEDILAGTAVSQDVRLKQRVNALKEGGA